MYQDISITQTFGGILVKFCWMKKAKGQNMKFVINFKVFIIVITFYISEWEDIEGVLGYKHG